MLKKLYYSVVLYVALGLVSGVSYREFTRAVGYTEWSQLRSLHTHLLVLGAIMFLILIALEKLFALSQAKSFRAFFYTYHAGLLITATMMAVKGCLQVLGNAAASSKALAGIAGLGHITLAAALIALLVALKARIWATQAESTVGELHAS